MLPGEAGTAVQLHASLRGDQAGAEQILRARAGGGDWHPARELAGRLAQHGDLDEWPFVAQPDYTGPMVQALGGADISWLIGGFGAAISYLLLVTLTTGGTRHDRQVTETAR